MKTKLNLSYYIIYKWNDATILEQFISMVRNIFHFHCIATYVYDVMMLLKSYRQQTDNYGM